MIWGLNQILNGLFDCFMWPCRVDSPWPGLVVSSFVTAAVLVAIYYVSSDPAAILVNRNRLFARTLELLLFQHDLRVSLSACGRIWVTNFYYLVSFARPMFFASVPLLLLMTQQSSWFGTRPISVGEQAVFTVALSPEHSVVGTDVKLQVSENLSTDTPGVRIRSTNEIAWRIVSATSGLGWVEVNVAGAAHRKSIVIGRDVIRLSPDRVSRGFWSELFSPSEMPLDVNSPVQRMSISYPQREISLGSKELSWFTASIGLMMIFSLLIGRITGVRIV